MKGYKEKFAEGIVVIKSANNGIHNENGNGYGGPTVCQVLGQTLWYNDVIFMTSL